MIHIDIATSQQETKTFGRITFVDLAGSERIDKTFIDKKRLEESKFINHSLSALGNVINCLSTNNNNHVPYRSSKLTRVLQSNLNRHSLVVLLATVSSNIDDTGESLSTLRFAE